MKTFQQETHHMDDFSFDVPMPGETFLSPPAKIRSFIARSGIGRLAGISASPHMISAPPLAAPVARER